MRSPGPRRGEENANYNGELRRRRKRRAGSELLDEVLVEAAARRALAGRGLFLLRGGFVALEVLPLAVGGGGDAAEAEREVVRVGDVLERLLVGHQALLDQLQWRHVDAQEAVGRD